MFENVIKPKIAKLEAQRMKLIAENGEAAKELSTLRKQAAENGKSQVALKQSQETIAKLEKQLVDLEAGHKTSTQETKTKNARKHSELQNALTIARQEAAAAFK